MTPDAAAGDVPSYMPQLGQGRLGEADGSNLGFQQIPEFFLVNLVLKKTRSNSRFNYAALKDGDEVLFRCLASGVSGEVHQKTGKIVSIFWTVHGEERMSPAEDLVPATALP